MIRVLNQWAAAWWNLMAQSVIQDTVFLLIILLMLYLFRRKHARFLRALTLIGLFKLLIPSVSLPFLAMNRLQLTAPILHTIQPSKLPGMAASTASHPALITRSATFAWESRAFLLWLGGVGVILLIAGIQYLRLRRVRVSAKPMNLEAVGLPDERLPYLLFQSSRIESPFVLGIFRPVIILPSNWDTLDRPIQRAILRHERQHIRQHDALLHSAQIFIQALFFFHPLVWILISLSHKYSEIVCDDAGIQEARIDPDRYLQTILSFFPTRRTLRVVPSFMSPFLLMKSRIIYQHHKQEDAMQPLRKTYMLLLVILFMAVVPFSCHTPDTPHKTATAQSPSADTGKTAPVNIPGTKWVSYRLGFIVKPDQQGMFSSQVSLVEQLSQDDYLESVNVSEENNSTITADVQYLFSNMKSFQQWFHSDSVQQLIQSIEQHAESFQQRISSR